MCRGAEGRELSVVNIGTSFASYDLPCPSTHSVLRGGFISPHPSAPGRPRHCRPRCSGRSPTVPFFFGDGAGHPAITESDSPSGPGSVRASARRGPSAARVPERFLPRHQQGSVWKNQRHEHQSLEWRNRHVSAQRTPALVSVSQAMMAAVPMAMS